jgi:hypothetical protein
MAVTGEDHSQRKNLSLWLTSLAGPVLLLLICIGFYWKTVLTDQYTYLESPDLANQVLPWLRMQATELHRWDIPLWDPYLLGGWVGTFGWPQMPNAIFLMFTVLVGGLQILPAYEYGRLSKRGAGAAAETAWDEPVPCSVHSDVFHGTLYALAPLVEKARSPDNAVFIYHFESAVLTAYRIDYFIDKDSPWPRRAIVARIAGGPVAGRPAVRLEEGEHLASGAKSGGDIQGRQRSEYLPKYRRLSACAGCTQGTLGATGKGPRMETCQEGDDVRLMRHSAGHVTMVANMGCKGMVILGDSCFPGWGATVDGKPAEAYEAHTAVRGETLIGIFGAVVLNVRSRRREA